MHGVTGVTYMRVMGVIKENGFTRVTRVPELIQQWLQVFHTHINTHINTHIITINIHHEH